MNKKSVTLYSGEVVRMNELTSPQTKKILPVISTVTFVGFLDTHLLIPVMSLYASELGAGYAGDALGVKSGLLLSPAVMVMALW